MLVETISEQLFFTTMRIDTLSKGASGSGTAFVVNHTFGEQTAPFLVTNKHVVFDQIQGWVTFHTGKEAKVSLGEGFRLEVGDWEKAWFGHPDEAVDIAITPLNPIIEHVHSASSKGIFYRGIPSSIFLTQAQSSELDAMEEVTFVGYPNGIWDEVNLLPIVRRGMTASPLQVDFGGKPQFVIDASVFGGSSGSPVFLHSRGSYATRDGGTIIGSRAIFVGVVTAVFYRTSLNKIISIPIPTAVQPMAEQSEMLDLGIVTKARAVTETIEALLESRGLLKRGEGSSENLA